MAQADYIYLNGRPVAVLNGSTLYYLHDDRLGTPQLATDSSQNTQWQASYEPFGQTASVSGTITQNLRLPGQYFDVESGWNHNGFRDYVPELGRYVEPDPLGRLGSGNNLFVYVGDNPVNFADPLGLCAAMISASNNAPNNATPWYQSCTAKALGAGALHVGIDAIGLIPEAGGISRMIGHQAGYVGVVADQVGYRVVNAFGKSTGTVSSLAGLSGESVAEGVWDTSLTVAGFIPALNDVAAVLSIGTDIVKTAVAVGKCP